MNALSQLNPVLSLVLCSRNDQYMGNSRWRLETTLNYVANNIAELGREKDVEILVTDWGSEIPLRDILQLSPIAARIVSFLWVPPQIARYLQKDSPFPEVLALNAGVRRAKGEYIGRIDQDTLVGKRFLEIFFDLYKGTLQLEVPLDSSLLFSNLRMIPYRFAVRCPSLWAVDQFVRCFGLHLKPEISLHGHFYSRGVGICLLSRSLWIECGGYDERMIYMNDMEINMIARLKRKYAIVNLGEVANYDFYHLEHYHPKIPRRSAYYRQVNRKDYKDPDSMHPNGEEWGLRGYVLDAEPYTSTTLTSRTTRRTSIAYQGLRFILLMFCIAVQIGWDGLNLSFRKIRQLMVQVYFVWMHRAEVARNRVAAQPISRWPGVLISLWLEKR